MPIPTIEPLEQTLTARSSKELFVDKKELGMVKNLNSTKFAATPIKAASPAAVSPSFSDVDSFNCEDEAIQNIGKTDHKILEERGFPEEEPLLKENPQRFVLFPIQDNEVSHRADSLPFYN